MAVFATLVDRGALSAPDGRGGELTLGPDRTAFTDLGVDLDAVDRRRRKLATACLDRTQRLPHLGGALGSAVLTAFRERDLVRPDPEPGSRRLCLTPAGRRELPVLLPGFAPASPQRATRQAST